MKKGKNEARYTQNFNRPSLVASVMIDGHIGILGDLLRERLPDRLLILGCVRPEGVLRSSPMILY